MIVSWARTPSRVVPNHLVVDDGGQTLVATEAVSDMEGQLQRLLAVQPAEQGVEGRKSEDVFIMFRGNASAHEKKPVGHDRGGQAPVFGQTDSCEVLCI